MRPGPEPIFASRAVVPVAIIHLVSSGSSLADRNYRVFVNAVLWECEH